MTKFLLLSDHSNNVIGLAALRRGLEGLFGPLEVQPLSSQIWGLYTGLVYFTPIFGGLLADRVLGQRRTVVVGATLMAIGHFMMAVEQLFLFALLALILGSGCFKPNISTQVGGLYARGRSAPRPRLFYFLCRHQSRRVSGAARLRHIGRTRRLALRLCRRRRRHADRSVHLSLRAAAAAGRRIAQSQIRARRARGKAAGCERATRHLALTRSAHTQYAVLGDLRADGQHPHLVGRRQYRPQHRRVASVRHCARRSRPPGFSPSIRS